jgi:hypothetical protein
MQSAGDADYKIGNFNVSDLFAEPCPIYDTSVGAIYNNSSVVVLFIIDSAMNSSLPLLKTSSEKKKKYSYGSHHQPCRCLAFVA